MRRVTGARLIVEALEAEKVRWTFGIPGTHTIELYDALDRSSIEPVLVADERSAAFLADGIGRSGAGVGVLTLVPGAGATHAASGIAEAFMDQVPMVVILCGVRSDLGKAYQLHDIDQVAMLRPITKAVNAVRTAEEIVPAIRGAFQEASQGVPGPVVVEVPANLVMLTQEIEDRPWSPRPWEPPEPSPDAVEDAAGLLARSVRPLLYVGRGARGAVSGLIRLAEALRSPVATTIQGKGVFPESHPLFLWNGLGDQAPPFVRRIGREADCVLAIGCRFAEAATGSYGFELPERLIHVDMDPSVPGWNVPAELTVVSDAGMFVEALLSRVERRAPDRRLEVSIAEGHRRVRAAWRKERSSAGVTPNALFEALRRYAARDTIWVTDSGNGTFLAMERLRIDAPERFLGPIDFSCMGYSVPAAIGAKLANPGRDVVALVGDGAFLMTGMELLTASRLEAGAVFVVLRDGLLGQVAQFQQSSSGRRICSELPFYGLEEIATGLGCAVLRCGDDGSVDAVIEGALSWAREDRRPVVVDLTLGVSGATWFTRGVLRTSLRRLPARDRWRMTARAIGRRIVR